MIFVKQFGCHSIKRITYFLGYSFLFCLSFPNIFLDYGVPVGAWFCLIPLLIGLQECENYQERLIFGFWAGMISYSGLVWWLYLANVGGTFLFVFFLSLQLLLFSLFFRRIRSILSVFYLSILWLLTEQVRVYFLGGFEWTLGHSQVFVFGLPQVMEYLGPPGMSAVLVFVNGLCYLFFTQNYKKRYLGLALSVILFLFFVGWFSQQQVEKKKDKAEYLTVCLVQPAIDSKTKKDPEKVYEVVTRNLALSQECIRSQSDLVVWPETAVADDLQFRPKEQKMIQDFIDASKVSLLFGNVVNQEGKDFNTAVLWDRSAKQRSVYYKQKLVPFMEYYPFKNWARPWLYDNQYEFSAGEKIKIFEVRGKWKIFPVICSEDGYPGLFRQVVKEKIDGALVLSSNTWSEVKAVEMMHLQNSITQAISFRMVILRCANSGWSGMIGADGQLSQGVEFLGKEHVFIERFYRRDNQFTIYAKYGKLFAVFCAVFVIIYLLLNRNLNEQRF